MNVFDGVYYIRIKRFLTFCGHWPYLTTKQKIINQTLLFLAALTIIIPQTSKLFELRHDFQAFVLAIPSIFYYVEFVCKSFFAALQGNKIKKVLEKVKHDFEMLKDEDLKILQSYASTALKANNLYFACMFTVVSAYSVVPFVFHVLEIVIPGNVTLLPGPPRLITYHIENLDNSVSFIIIHGFIVDLTSLVIMVAFDTLTFMFAYHVCGLFVIVTKKMHEAFELRSQLTKNSCLKTRKIYEDILYRKLVETIDLHRSALEFVNILESALAILNLFSIGCALIPLTIAEYGVIVNKGNYAEMIRFCIFVYGEIGHTIYYNWPGQKLIDHSLLVYKSCYDCEWYREDIPDKCKKLLNYMMLVSQKPCSLTAGKVYVLGLENFAAILKLSMSYFTVLSSIM